MMRKSTRLLALLLCVVMMATLLPTFALADVGTTVVDNKGVGKDIFTLSQDRYTINENPGYTDTGYGYETTYLFPKGNGTVTFNITRNADDYNRWWRWAADNTVYNQRKTNEELGYVASQHDTHTSTTADPTNPTVNIDDWTAKIVNKYSDNQPIPRNNERYNKVYILSKPLLSPRPSIFYWRGGSDKLSAKVEVSINTNKPLGTHSILWSANGTSEDQWFAYVDSGSKPNNNNGLNKDRRVHYGDLGQNFMYIVEQRTVTYQLDGGEMPNGDTNDQQYIVWTTGTASTSQKHKVITAVPEKAGMTFNGWYCPELGKMVTAGADLNNGITQNMTLVAQWTPNVEDPDYFVHFNGNGETSGSMKDQGFKIDMPQNLNLNQFVQTYTINYNGNSGKSERTSEEVNSDFRGWTKVGGQQANVDYTDGQEVVNLVPSRTDPVSTVDLYAQWTPGTVILPGAFRDVTEDDADDDIVEWMFEGWYTKPGDDGKFVGMDGAQYKLTQDGETLYAHWKAIKEDVFFICHSSTGQIEAVSMKGLVNRNTYKAKDSDGEWRDNSYLTGYTDTMYDITKETESGYLYGGTFADENYTQVADFRGLYDVVTTKYVAFVGTTADTVTPTYTEAGTPAAFHPQSGKTYYIWEVSKQHLNPMTVSVWANVDGGYDVTHIYLMTAVDRTLYNQAGFTVDGRDYVAANSTNKEIYDQVGITQSGNTTYKSYYDLSRADTTQNSKVACFEVTGLTPGTNVTVVPYWITLDGVKVTGPAQRIFQYKGPGATNSNRMLKIVSDTWITSTATPAPSPVSFAAPLKSAPRFMASQASPVVIQTPDIVTVFDAGKEYTVEAVDNSIKDLIQPAGQDGKLFSGWYADEAFAEVANLNAVEDGDSVYAKYVSDKYMQVKYSAVFTLLNKTISLTSAVDSKDYAETGYVISTKNGDDKVVVSKYATKFALQNANQLFGVEKTAPLMNVDYKLNGLSKNDKITITPYWVTADGTTVYGTARTLTYTGLTMKG